MEILNNLVCVWVDCTMWCGRKKLCIEDLNNVSEADIPPEDLATLGSKRIFPKEPLQPFYALRKRTERLCLSVGTRFMGGFAIPADKRHWVAGELNKIKDEYQAEVKKLMSCYDKMLSEFIAEHPKWGGMIEKAAKQRSEIMGQFKYMPHIMGINIPEGMEKGSHIKEAIAGIVPQVMKEVATMAKTMLEENHLEQRDSTCNGVMLASMRKWYAKIVCMSFVDRNLAVIASRMENILNGLPQTGEITGADYQQMLKLVRVLADVSQSEDLKNYPQASLTLDLKKPAVVKTTRHKTYKGNFLDGNNSMT